MDKEWKDYMGTDRISTLRCALQSYVHRLSKFDYWCITSAKNSHLCPGISKEFLCILFYQE